MNFFKALIILALVIGNLLPAGSCVWAESDSQQEYRVKVAFVYNFAKFVEWPEEAFSHGKEPLVFTVLGNDPFGEVLDTLVGKTVKGRPFTVTKTARLDDLKPCHILFIPKSERKRLPAIMAKIKDWPVLAISDSQRFTQNGGGIQFFLAGNKVRFAINTDAAEHHGLRISSQLLRLSQAPQGES